MVIKKPNKAMEGIVYSTLTAAKSQAAYLRYSLIKTPNTTPISVAMTMAKSESKRCSVVRCRKKGASSFRKVKMFVKVLCVNELFV